MVALDDLPEGWRGRELHELETLIAGLLALASLAPRLRTLQLVLPMLDGESWHSKVDLGPLWHGLAALSSLTSLALGWVFMEGERTRRRSERITDVLDAVQVGPAATVCAPL